MLENNTERLKAKIDPLRLKFPTAVITEFLDYWTEPNKSGTKQRWELEKTWDTERRLQRWANTSFPTKRTEVKGFQTQVQKEPTNEIERLDQFLMAYKKHPTNFQFIDLAKWYDLMKENKLLRPFTKAEVLEIQEVYKNDNLKCRAACVYETFKGYAKTDLIFSDILKMRK
jgi:hypothetical protein